MPHIDLDNPGEGHKQVEGVNQIEINGTWRVATKQEVEEAGPLIYPKPFDPMSFLEQLIMGDGTEGAPPGWFTTEKAAVEDARKAGVYSQRGFHGDPLPGVMYPYDIIRNGLYFTHVSREVEVTADKRYSLVVDPQNGHTYAIDLANPTKPRTDADIVLKAANKAPEGSKPIGDPIELGNGKTMQPYAITDANGVTTRYNVILEGDEAAPTAADIVTFTDAEGGGRLIPLGDGRYTYEAPPDAPFITSPSDVVPLPNQNGSLIKTSANQYQFVRDTYDPGVKTDPGTGRQFVQSASGTWTELAPRFDPAIQEVDGMALLQQRSGAVSQLAKPNLDQIITQALVDGEYDKAFAFQDFRDRPTAQEAFNTALAFARSPADQVLISSIARGEQTVQPPPPGTIQRVGPQPDFLVQAYQDFQRRTQAGRAPTEEEATTLSARAAAGASPLTDTLQSRLESLQADMARKDRESDMRIAGMQADMARKDRETDARIFKLFADAERAREDTASKEVKSGDTETAATTETTAASVTPIPDDEEDAEWGEQKTEENRLAVIADRTQQALDLGYSEADAAKLVSETPSGTPFSQALAMDLQGNLENMGQANALDLITTGSQAGGVPSQLANLAGLSSALEADPTAVLTQAGSGPNGLRFEERAGGGTVQPGEITVVGEQGPEIAMMPPGTHILPLGPATKRDIKAAQASGRAYQTGGIVFGELPFGLRQLQAGRPITPSRGYLSRAAGLTLPSAQALSNLTPETRDVYFDLAAQAGIPARAFGQELQTALPLGRRLPTSRMLPLGRRGVR